MNAWRFRERALFGQPVLYHGEFKQLEAEPKLLITVLSRWFTLSMAAISLSTPPQTRSPHECVSLWIAEKNQSQDKKSWEQQRRPPLCPLHTRRCDSKGAPR